MVSGKIKDGSPVWIKVVSEKGGELRIKLPFGKWHAKNVSISSIKDGFGIVSVKLKKGESVVFENANK